MRKKTFLLAALCFSGVALTAADAPAAEEKPVVAPPAAEEKAAPAADPLKDYPEVIAEGKNVKVIKQALREALLAQIPDGKLPELPKEQWDGVVYYQGKMLVFMQLIENAAREEKFAPDDAALSAFIKAQLEKQPMVMQMLSMQKKTVDDAVREIMEKAGAKASIVQQMFLQQKLGKVAVTDDDAKKFYDEHLDQMTIPADGEKTMRASHILVSLNESASDADKKAAETKINDALAKVKADPASFEKVAEEVSDCPSGKRGGDLGAFEPGQMVPEFEKALLALKDGEISNVVKTQFGYHVIRRNARQEKKVLSFEQTKERIIQVLTMQEEQKRIKEYVEKLEKEADVKFAVPAPKEK